MLAKPTGCVGCPGYASGKGFVPDEWLGAPVTVFLQNPGADEEREGKPAVGATGDFLNKALLPAAGLERGKNVNVCNAFRCRWSGTNDLPPKEILSVMLQHCRQYDKETKGLTVVCGAVAAQAFGLKDNVSSWRGFLLPDAL